MPSPCMRVGREVAGLEEQGLTHPYGIPQGHSSSQLWTRGTSLSKLNTSTNQVTRATHSETVLIIQRLRDKAACPEAFGFQQSKFGIHTISSASQGFNPGFQEMGV